MKIEVGDIVLCTVDRVIGINVFVKIEDNGEGCIVMSEIAPGRIRNIRDYVVPKKKIALFHNCIKFHPYQIKQYLLFFP